MNTFYNWILLDVLNFNIENIMKSGVPRDQDVNQILVLTGAVIFVVLMILTVAEFRNYKNKKVDKYGKIVTSKTVLILTCIADVVYLIVCIVHLAFMLMGY